MIDNFSNLCRFCSILAKRSARKQPRRLHPRQRQRQVQVICEGKFNRWTYCDSYLIHFRPNFVIETKQKISKMSKLLIPNHSLANLLKALRSQLPSRNQQWELWRLPIKTLSIWLQGATAHRRTRWKMRWPIPMSLQMHARPHRQKPLWQLQLQLQSPKSSQSLKQQLQPVLQALQRCWISSRRATFLKTFSSNSFMLASQLRNSSLVRWTNHTSPS